MKAHELYDSGFLGNHVQQAEGMKSNSLPNFLTFLTTTQGSNINTYNALLSAMFNCMIPYLRLSISSLIRTYVASDGANSAGINYIRVPLGASDFSPRVYSYDDQNLDISLSSFSVESAPPEVFSTLHDIQAINKELKVHLVPWSPVSLKECRLECEIPITTPSPDG